MSTDSTALDEQRRQKGHNWNDLPVYQKRGTAIIRGETGWQIDRDIPIFTTPEGREYIERHLAKAADSP